MKSVVRFLALIWMATEPHTAWTAERRIAPDELQALVAETRERFHFPAVAVAVMDSKAVQYLGLQGTRVTGGAESATLDDYFHIGSCSKSVLAVAAARLVEQGALAWETKFFDLFPELRAGADPAYQGITLEDLFLCRAGIRAFTDAAREPLPELSSSSARDRRAEFIGYLVRQPPAARRKDRAFEHLYSNGSYVMAAAMLERASGQRYEELIRNLVTREMGLPLHMGWPNALGPHQPWGHMIEGTRITPFEPENGYVIPDMLTPAGDLSMTPGAFAEYTRQHLAGLRGESGVIAAPSWRRIHGEQEGFALGVVNGKLLGHSYSGFDGSAGTFFCRALLLPEDDFGFVVMTNAGSSTGHVEGVDWLSRRIVERGLDLNWLQRAWLWVWW